MVICLKQVAIFNDFYMWIFSLQSLLLFLDMQCYTLVFMDFFWEFIYILGRDIKGCLWLQKGNSELIELCLEYPIYLLVV